MSPYMKQENPSSLHERFSVPFVEEGPHASIPRSSDRIPDVRGSRTVQADERTCTNRAVRKVPCREQDPAVIGKVLKMPDKLRVSTRRSQPFHPKAPARLEHLLARVLTQGLSFIAQLSLACQHQTPGGKP